MIEFYMSDFHYERETQTLRQLEKIKADLPPFCSRFFLGISQNTSPLTRLNYAYDLRVFFEFLRIQIDIFIGRKIWEFEVSDLEKITTFHIELFMDFLKNYDPPSKDIQRLARAPVELERQIALERKEHLDDLNKMALYGYAANTLGLDPNDEKFELYCDMIELANAGKNAGNPNIEVVHIPPDLRAFSEVSRNGEKAIMRKVSCLRAFFKYFFKNDEISKNIMPNVDLPKQHTKPIVRLERDEMLDLFAVVDAGTGLTRGQKKFHNLTSLRDGTIVVFFLTTGVRISELVGLNVGDIDLEGGKFTITRKGGNRDILFMPDELRDQLAVYLQNQFGSVEISDSSIKAKQMRMKPLFMSLQNKRLGVRSVQNLIGKYAKLAVPLKNISPHKLRSTFGTNLYRSTKDIYVVADILGHKDVNTTKKHYAAISDDVRREAAGKVKIFE